MLDLWEIFQGIVQHIVDDYLLTKFGSNTVHSSNRSMISGGFWLCIAINLFSSGFLAFGLAIFHFSWDNQNTTRRGHPLLALSAWFPYVLGVVIGVILVLQLMWRQTTH